MFTSGPTLSERLRAVDHRAAGWDYLRFGLALGVILFHTAVTVHGPEAQAALKRTWLGVPVGLLMPMFFALSGYLVTSSLERSRSVGGFLGLRALRILPALAGHTLFCALVLGPLFTTMTLAAYVRSATFHTFFITPLGLVPYRLPGVFEANPLADVNGHLWTVPAELACYLVLAALAVLGAHRRRWLMAALFVAGSAALQARALLLSRAPQAEQQLMLFFMAGVLVCLFRDRIRRNAGLAWLSLALSAAFIRQPVLACCAPLPVAYLTVYLGLANPRKWALLRSGDYSYGMYLYGFTVQQALVASLPLGRVGWGNFLLAAPLSLLLAALSWHAIEKRALACRHRLYGACASPDAAPTAPTAQAAPLATGDNIGGLGSR